MMKSVFIAAKARTLIFLPFFLTINQKNDKMFDVVQFDGKHILGYGGENGKQSNRK